MAILSGVGFGDRLPWRRDWSKHPRAWVTYLFFAVTYLAIGVVYLALGRQFGIFWLVLGVASVLTSAYTFRAARRGRPDPQLREIDGEPH